MTGMPTLPPYLLEKEGPCLWYLHIMGKDGQSEGFFMRLELSTTDLGDEQERADDQATVEFIVKACNAHAELVATLRRLADAVDRYEDNEVRTMVKETALLALRKAGAE